MPAETAQQRRGHKDITQGATTAAGGEGRVRAPDAPHGTWQRQQVTHTCNLLCRRIIMSTTLPLHSLIKVPAPQTVRYVFQQVCVEVLVVFNMKPHLYLLWAGLL